jgi:5-methylcytosine-specific restriction endonuclease McrA
MSIIPGPQLSLPFDDLSEKRCTKCLTVKSLSEFHKQKKLPDGHKCYCKACCKEINHQHYIEKIEEKRTYRRQYYQDNKEAFKACAQRRYRANTERIKEQVKAWQKSHWDKTSSYKAKWDKANPEIKRVHVQRRYARRKGAASVHFTKQQLEDKKRYWGYRCWVCGEPYEAMDHVKPLAKHGPHILANLRPICWRCNSSKNDRWPYP